MTTERDIAVSRGAYDFIGKDRRGLGDRAFLVAQVSYTAVAPSRVKPR